MRHTPKEHPEYEEFENLMHRISEIVAIVNERTRQVTCTNNTLNMVHQLMIYTNIQVESVLKLREIEDWFENLDTIDDSVSDEKSNDYSP